MRRAGLAGLIRSGRIDLGMLQHTDNLLLDHWQIASGSGVPHGPLVPTWLAVTMATFMLLSLMVHMAWIRRSDMPSSRKRIRTVNGWLMLAAIPLLAYAFGIAIPSQARSFVLVWAASVGLIGIIVMLAMLDMLNNWRIHRRAAARLRREMELLRKTRVAASPKGEAHGEG